VAVLSYNDNLTRAGNFRMVDIGINA